MEPIHKLGGTICNGCRATISTNHTEDLLCDRCEEWYDTLLKLFSTPDKALELLQDAREKEISRQIENRGRWDNENL